MQGSHSSNILLDLLGIYYWSDEPGPHMDKMDKIMTVAINQDPEKVHLSLLRPTSWSRLLLLVWLQGFKFNTCVRNIDLSTFCGGNCGLFSALSFIELHSEENVRECRAQLCGCVYVEKVQSFTHYSKGKDFSHLEQPSFSRKSIK